MKTIMLDIETLSTRPDSAIIQIGAVQIDRPTGAVSNPLLVSVDKDFYDDNRSYHVDKDTVKWWANRGSLAKNSLEINKVATLPMALDSLTEYFEDVGFVQSYKFNYDEVWGNGQFDLPILNYAYAREFGKSGQTPWKFRQERDLRTLVAEYQARYDIDPTFSLPPQCDDLVMHRADHDAIRQAYILLEITK